MAGLTRPTFGPQASTPMPVPAQRASHGGGGVRAYGHAERNLAGIRRLEWETAQLLRTLDALHDEQQQWLTEYEAQQHAHPAGRSSMNQESQS